MWRLVRSGDEARLEDLPGLDWLTLHTLLLLLLPSASPTHLERY